MESKVDHSKMSDSVSNPTASSGNNAAGITSASVNSTPVSAASGASPLSADLPSPTAAQVERARLEAGWRSDLARLEYEIETLRTVLNAKTNQAAELKRKLGISPITEIKQDLQQGLQAIRESDAYNKTGTALKTFGDFASRKLSDLRNSNAFKSVEGKVGSAYQSVKSSQSVGNLRSRLSRGPSDEGFSDSASSTGLTGSASVSSGMGSSATGSGLNDTKPTSGNAEKPSENVTTSEEKPMEKKDEAPL